MLQHGLEMLSCRKKLLASIQKWNRRLLYWFRLTLLKLWVLISCDCCVCRRSFCSPTEHGKRNQLECILFFKKPYWVKSKYGFMYCRDVVKFRNCFTFIAVSNNLRHGYIYIYIYIYRKRKREGGERERERRTRQFEAMGNELFRECAGVKRLDSLCIRTEIIRVW